MADAIQSTAPIQGQQPAMGVHKASRASNTAVPVQDNSSSNDSAKLLRKKRIILEEVQQQIEADQPTLINNQLAKHFASLTPAQIEGALTQLKANVQSEKELNKLANFLESRLKASSGSSRGKNGRRGDSGMFALLFLFYQNSIKGSNFTQMGELSQQQSENLQLKAQTNQLEQQQTLINTNLSTMHHQLHEKAPWWKMVLVIVAVVVVTVVVTALTEGAGDAAVPEADGALMGAADGAQDGAETAAQINPLDSNTVPTSSSYAPDAPGGVDAPDPDAPSAEEPEAEASPADPAPSDGSPSPDNTTNGNGDNANTQLSQETKADGKFTKVMQRLGRGLGKVKSWATGIPLGIGAGAGIVNIPAVKQGLSGDAQLDVQYDSAQAQAYQSKAQIIQSAVEEIESAQQATTNNMNNLEQNQQTSSQMILSTIQQIGQTQSIGQG